LIAPTFLLGVTVGASTVILLEANPVVVVAHDRWNLFVADSLDHFIRRRGIADQIAQTIQSVERVSANVREHGFQSRKVGMDVTENCDLHI
jgi:hypothetical protein